MKILWDLDIFICKNKKAVLADLKYSTVNSQKAS
jgi:hypothetical protein